MKTTKQIHLLLTVLFSMFALGGWADSHDFTVRPSLEKFNRFSGSNGSYSFVKNYPIDYTTVSGTYEINYYTRMVVLQQYDLPTDIDWNKVSKITIQSTTSTSGILNYWIYGADAENTFNDANAFATATETAIGTSTKNEDAITSYSTTTINDYHFSQTAEITGDKLAALKEKISNNKIAFVIAGDNTTKNAKYYMYSSNDANNTTDGDFRPVIYIDYYPVYNETTKVGYNTLKDAFNKLSTIETGATEATKDLLSLYHDATLDARIGTSGNRIVSIKPMREGITLRRGNTKLPWFLINDKNVTLNIGCDEYQLTMDGESASYSLFVCESVTMNVNNVKITNFEYGTDGRLAYFKNAGGYLTLKNVFVENCQTETEFFINNITDYGLVLDGSLTFSKCTGTNICVQKPLKINGESFTTTTPITLKITNTNLSAGSLIVKTNSKDAATANASRFIDVDNNFIFVPSTASSHYHEILLAKGYTMKVSSAKAVTFVLPYESTIPEGMKAYTLTYTSGDKAQATEVTETLPANTPVLINAEEGYYQFKATDATATEETATNPQSGCLVGAFEETTVPEGAYVLQNQNGNVGFYKVTSSSAISIKANQAYLVISSSEAKPASISIDFDSATAIQAVEEANAECDNAIYNLSGMRVSKENLTKGQLYITKGKTFIAR